MLTLIISPAVRDKIAAREITQRDIEQCFENRCGEFLVDDREENKSDPATLWFISETNHGRLLKVVFIPRDGNYTIRSAYPANSKQIRIYDELAK